MPRVPKSGESRCVWTDTDDEIMIEELKVQKSKGNQAQSGWKPVAWTAVNDRVNTEGRKKGLPKTAKKTKVSGFGWDENKKMVVATDEWWEQHLKKHPSDAKWRTTAFPLYDDMFYLVHGIIATGNDTFHAGGTSEATPRSPLAPSPTPDDTLRESTPVDASELVRVILQCQKNFANHKYSPPIPVLLLFHLVLKFYKHLPHPANVCVLIQIHLMLGLPPNHHVEVKLMHLLVLLMHLNPLVLV
ncbi:hypothetical protein K435DRAFT_679348 [Dendrothele bispora CBS 962.96]|uniref:Myb/SANT-like domain-containing protein n=1 Tax=Dendrothele bispora (strain CBS 962.96) TaxID=1314807 RepID=A0A4S8LIG0_DENBC|nr:hypothetical protein K435DRAFT_679348 [Dendrothele bispora CBS 962.96]